MATVFNPNQQDDEDKNKQDQNPTQPTAPISPTGAGGAPASQPSAAPTVQASGQGKAGSGRFLNIQKYLSANQGADYAGKIGQNIQDQQNQFQSNLGSTQQDVNNQGTSEVNRLQQGQGLISQALANPTQFAGTTLSQNQNSNNVNTGNPAPAPVGLMPEGQPATPASNPLVDEFNKLRTGNYSTVNTDLSGLANQQQQLGQSADLSKSESGRFQLLRNAFGGNNYNTGQNRLDQLILQGQSGQLRNLQNTTGQAAAQSAQNLANLQNTVQNYNTQIGTLGDQAKTAAQTGINNLVQGTESDLQKRVSDLQAQRQGQYTAAQQALLNAPSQGLSKDLADQLGLSQGAHLYGMTGQDLANYLNPDIANQTVNLGNVTTAADVAKLQALSQLSGTPEVAQYAKVGDQLGNALQFNKDQLQSALQGKEAGFNQDLSNAYSNLNANQTIKNQLLSGAAKGPDGKPIIQGDLTGPNLAGNYNRLLQYYNTLKGIGNLNPSVLTAVGNTVQALQPLVSPYGNTLNVK